MQSRRITSPAERLGWSAGGVVLCAALAVTAQQGVRRMPAEWSIENLIATLDAPRDTNWEDVHLPMPVPEPEPAPAPAMTTAELANAINAQLREWGVETVDVHVDEAGTATATGSLASVTDHDALLNWLQSLPGVASVVDQVALPPPVTAAPAPEPPPAALPGANAQELADAINAELRQEGYDTVEVRIAEDGTATVAGQLDSAEDRDLVVHWLESLSGVTHVVDDIELTTSELDEVDAAGEGEAVR